MTMSSPAEATTHSVRARCTCSRTASTPISAFTAPHSRQTIGRAASNGCIRMLNAHVIDLYNRVPIGTVVTVV